MGTIELKIDLGQVDLDSLNTDSEIRALARSLIPRALREIGEASGEVMWKMTQKALSGLGGISSSADKRKFIQQAGNEYFRKATANSRKEIEDYIVREIYAKKNKRIAPGGKEVEGVSRLEQHPSEAEPEVSKPALTINESEHKGNPMKRDSFPRRDVRRAFRKFSDMGSDVTRAQFQTWEAHLKNLLDFCETDPIMDIITDPLRHNPNINIEQWHKDFQTTVGSMVGSGQYEIPKNDDDRTALFYQVLRAFSDGKIDPGRFAVHAFGETKYQEIVNVINLEFVDKFIREMQYRIQDIEDDTQGQIEVERKALTVFHVYNAPVQKFDNVQNSPISIGDVMGGESQKSDDHSINTRDITNSNFVAHSSDSNQSIYLRGETGDILESILAILNADSAISEDDRQDAIQDVESLKIQLGKKKKDCGTIEKIVNALEKVGPVASLATKILELVSKVSS